MANKTRENYQNFLRTWNLHGLQSLSLSGNVLQFDPVTSSVQPQPVNMSNVLQQSLVFENGSFWNHLLGKILSLNAGTLKADTNDTRGAITWNLSMRRLQ